MSLSVSGKDQIQPELNVVLHGESCQVTKEALKFTQNKAPEHTNTLLKPRPNI